MENKCPFLKAVVSIAVFITAVSAIAFVVYRYFDRKKKSDACYIECDCENYEIDAV